MLKGFRRIKTNMAIPKYTYVINPLKYYGSKIKNTCTCILFGHKLLESNHPNAFYHQKKREVCTRCGLIVKSNRIKRG